jgi:uncharacterized protein YyaL (SSP411 family)
VPDAQVLRRIVAQFRQSFDGRRGGFGDAPKFPRPGELLFLLREYARTGDEDARTMALATLRAMAIGGIRDHIGGGFHRYSVDGAWRVPHFEKMLYDQAQLVLAYAEAGQSTDTSMYSDVAEDTLHYVMREMTDPDGGFYSAEDADSIPPEQAANPRAHRAEGAFYLWTEDEVDRLLGEDAAIVKRRFGLEPGGNAPSDPQQEFTGKNLLYIAQSVSDIAAATGRAEADAIEALSRARVAMFGARARRPRPHLDDKILAAWNGLMIAAFARVARMLGVRGHTGTVGAGIPYLQAAKRAAGFVRDRMWNASSRTLLRRFRAGEAEIDGYAEDYACMIFGLLEIFQADPDADWLNWAITLQRRQDELFWDEKDGGWFSTTGEDPNVLLRIKEDYDGAEPAASSISVMNLLFLSHLIDDRTWTERIERTLRLFGARLEQAGRTVPMMGAALSAYAAGLQQVVIVDGAGADALEESIARRYQPFTIVLRVSPERQQALADLLPFIRDMRALDGAAAAYVCRHFACRQPVTTDEALQAELSHP